MNITDEIIRKYQLGGNNNIRMLAKEFNIRRKKIKKMLIDADINIRSSKESRIEQIKAGYMIGHNHPRYGKKPPVGAGRCRWYYYNGKIYQGSWEFMFGLWLEQQNINFLTHKGSKQFKVAINDYNNVTYCPDFYLPDDNKYIEIKGYFTDKDKQKIICFRKQYPNILLEIYDKQKFSELKIFEIRNKINIDEYELDYHNNKSFKKFKKDVNKCEFILSFIFDSNLKQLSKKYGYPYRIVNMAYKLWVPKYGSCELHDFVFKHCKEAIINDYNNKMHVREIARKYKFRNDCRRLKKELSIWGVKNRNV